MYEQCIYFPDDKLLFVRKRQVVSNDQSLCKQRLPVSNERNANINFLKTIVGNSLTYTLNRTFLHTVPERKKKKRILTSPRTDSSAV